MLQAKDDSDLSVVHRLPSKGGEADIFQGRIRQTLSLLCLWSDIIQSITNEQPSYAQSPCLPMVSSRPSGSKALNICYVPGSELDAEDMMGRKTTHPPSCLNNN